eukprot:CAMPEP_0179091848 /NCGR_PEP_ID=MMETSP0796-20121207/41978_1 /TAXON_ID=73915 /ORGANISM="Pyrodinium bahamense, Strain pbaha01" /LENGTH=223 /DNA_ID=CAMNT_0020789445 /DNA_START=56 /DNA_END=723 /DNA_ORIENTATION=+
MAHILFLDVDGVLNSTQPDSPSLGIEPMLLQLIVDIAGAVGRDGSELQVVISSDWRRSISLMTKLSETLSHAGLSVQGSIPAELPKQQGIRQWIAQHGKVVKNWVVLDDFDLKGLDDLDCELAGASVDGRCIFEGHFVKTDETIGLSQADAQKAVRLLLTDWANKAVQLEHMNVALAVPLQAAPTSASPPLLCNECGALLRDSSEARTHMEVTGGEHCMFSAA